MKRWPGFATAFGLSAALHVTVVGIAGEREREAQMAGRSSPAVAVLGNGFAKLAACFVAESPKEIVLEPVEPGEGPPPAAAR